MATIGSGSSSNSKRFRKLSLANDIVNPGNLNSRSVMKISAKKVLTEIEQDPTIIINLSDPELNDSRIEDLSAEFGSIIQGEIKTAIAPTCLKLKNDEHHKEFKVSTMKHILGALKIDNELKHPFLRFDKVQMLYIPLYGNRSVEDGQIHVRLVDEEREKLRRKGTIQRVSFNMCEMAIIELSMDFFVQKSSVGSISVYVNVDKPPLLDRSFGYMMIAFFIHGEQHPVTLKVRPSTVVYLDSLDAPIDVNRKTIFKEISDGITRKISEGRDRKLKRELALEEASREKFKQNVIIEENYDSESINEDDSVDDNLILCQGVIESDMTKISFDTYPTFLDTGSAHHFIKVNHIQQNSVVTIAGMKDAPCEIKTVFVRLQNTTIKLSDAYHYNNNGLNENLLSYSQLIKDGIVDGMKDDSGETILLKNSEVLLSFDSTSPGRIYLKNKVWYDKKFQ